MSHPSSENPSFHENEGYRLDGQQAVVTGSSSGIGRAIALELAAAGARVVIHANTSLGKAESVRNSISEATRGKEERAWVLTADLRDRDRLKRFIDECWDETGGVDIWVNNAGADILTGGRQSLPYEEKLDELLGLDVAGTVLLGREAAKRMKKRGGGVILNMGWDLAAVGLEGESGELFGAAKGAVMSFTRSLALSFAPEVRVNCLAPGWIRTAWGETASSSWQERVVRQTPLGRWGRPEDVARLALFLCSPASGYVTGQVVNCNGGAVR